MYYMKDNSSPVSIRLSQEEVDRLKEISGNKSVAAGVRELLKFYDANKGSVEDSDIAEFTALESEIKALKDSPFGFDKKVISQLEKELEKVRETYKKKKSESLKERILNLVKSAS